MPTVKVVGEYEWKAGFTSSVPAPLFAEQFDILREQVNGKVTPRAMVDFARPDSNALHPIFEWDDKVAAEEYRVDQARQAMNHLAIMVRNPANPTAAPILVRAIINVREDDDQGYLSIVNSLDEEAINRLRFIKSLRLAYQFWQECQMVSEADHVLRGIRRYLEQYSDEAKEAGVKIGDLYETTWLDSQPLLNVHVAQS